MVKSKMKEAQDDSDGNTGSIKLVGGESSGHVEFAIDKIDSVNLESKISAHEYLKDKKDVRRFFRKKPKPNPHP